MKVLKLAKVPCLSDRFVAPTRSRHIAIQNRNTMNDAHVLNRWQDHQSLELVSSGLIARVKLRCLDWRVIA